MGWREVEALLELLDQLHSSIRQVELQFRFAAITVDLDDNRFCDSAITAEAHFVVTDDPHFAALESAGSKPKPMSPDEFTLAHLIVG